MTKIYYLQQEVKLNDEIDFKGLKIKLTQEIIDNNPNLFILKEETIFPEYVKCVNNGNNSNLEIGKIYKQRLNLMNTTSVFGIPISLIGLYFQPSTKEEYDKQQEQIIINNVIEEAKKKFPLGSKFKKGDKIYSVGRTLDNKDIIYYDDLYNTFHIQCTTHNNPNLIAITIYDFIKKEWLAEPLPNSKSFEVYKQDLLNETPYAYLFTINQKLFYIELLSRIANDLNGDWKYKPNYDYYDITLNLKDNIYKIFNRLNMCDTTIKFQNNDIASKFLNIIPNNILDLIYKS